MFEYVKAGDRVTRILGGFPMELIVSKVTETLIICGSVDGRIPGGDETNQEGWWFDRRTGAEIDDELGWGPPPKMTGSYLVRDRSTQAAGGC